MITSVELSKKAEKDILKLPNHIQRKLRLWLNDVERLGLNEVQKISGYHDEPLIKEAISMFTKKREI